MIRKYGNITKSLYIYSNKIGTNVSNAPLSPLCTPNYRRKEDHQALWPNLITLTYNVIKAKKSFGSN